MLWTVGAASLVAGLMIGLTGIGGVLVVPALTELARVPLERAVAASMLGFLLAGIPPALVHLRRNRIEARPLAVLCLAAALGALVGAATLDRLPASAVRLFVALLALVSGLHALAGKGAQGASSQRSIPSPGMLGALGLAVGYASAISGTGGPVTLVPLLLALRTPVAPAIALGLAAQVPITLTATVVNAAEGRIDPALGAMLGALLTAGTLAGAWLSSRLSGRLLTLSVALLLIGVGIWYGYATLAFHTQG